MNRNLPLSDRIALSLGRMMLRFAALEAVTRHTLHSMLDLDDEDHRQLLAVIAGLPFRKVREALLAAARDRSEESGNFTDLRALMRRASRIEERRNILTHSFWVYSALPDAMMREKQHISSAGAIRSDAEAFRDVAGLEEFVAEINAVAEAVSRWYIEAYLGVHPRVT